MKRAITSRSRADTRDVEERVNSPESLQARRNRIPNRGLIAHVCDREARFAQLRRQGTAFLLVDPYDKHWMFGCP
jgi:hypothetical protein